MFISTYLCVLADEGLSEEFTLSVGIHRRRLAELSAWEHARDGCGCLVLRWRRCPPSKWSRGCLFSVFEYGGFLRRTLVAFIESR